MGGLSRPRRRRRHHTAKRKSCRTSSRCLSHARGSLAIRQRKKKKGISSRQLGKKKKIRALVCAMTQIDGSARLSEIKNACSVMRTERQRPTIKSKSSRRRRHSYFDGIEKQMRGSIAAREKKLGRSLSALSRGPLLHARRKKKVRRQVLRWDTGGKIDAAVQHSRRSSRHRHTCLDHRKKGRRLPA